jgi:hypothetical protein
MVDRCSGLITMAGIERRRAGSRCGLSIRFCFLVR